MSESRLSVDGYQVVDEEKFHEACREGRPGAFYLDLDQEGQPRALWVAVPSPSGGAEAGRLPLTGPEAWQFDGNRERPTLTPSIHAVGIWHGWLRAGRLESC